MLGTEMAVDDGREVENENEGVGVGDGMSGRRKNWDAALLRFITRCRIRGRLVIVMGDINVAPKDIDVSFPHDALVFNHVSQAMHQVPADPVAAGVDVD